MERSATSTGRLVAAACAAFCTYFCMYAFRKPFSAGTFTGQEVWGSDLKSVLVLSQIAGYMLAKFAGIKIISELGRAHRAAAILGMIVAAELALVGFAFAPLQLKVLMLFLNGLSLGMVFGVVLAYLEGRRQTEALSAVLCGSFILSSGVVKSVGRWLVLDMGVSEFLMPMVTGLIFLPALLLSVWWLQATPPPDEQDIEIRSERRAMKAADRRQFQAAYWPGLALLVFVYMALTVLRTFRDDFAVEIWRDVGLDTTPEIYSQSELVVAIAVTSLLGLTMLVRENRAAIRTTMLLMAAGFGLAAVAAWLHSSGGASGFAFMVACGIGLYIPYVAFHTTIFERLVAASRHPGNLGFLMYLADALGYFAYAAVLTGKQRILSSVEMLPFFRDTLLFMALVSIACLFASALYFRAVLTDTGRQQDVLAPAE